MLITWTTKPPRDSESTKAMAMTCLLSSLSPALAAASPWLPSPTVSLSRIGCCRNSSGALLVSRARISSEETSTKASLSEPSKRQESFTPEEDSGYLVKLALGSVAGAVVIKYGSVLLPGITKPNILEAFSIIGLPVVVAVSLLTIASFKDRNES